LVVEVDGSIHQQQAEANAERDRLLAARGLRVLHFSNEAVQESLPLVLEQILAACEGETKGEKMQ
jgi:very-short-patch-repair endonuclease